MLTIEEVRNKIYDLGSILGLDKGSSLYPMFSNSSKVFGEGVSVYIEDLKYHYVAMERGQIRKHHESNDIDEILYLVFDDITFSLASDYEVKHRRENEDFRRLLWKKQLELLDSINKDYSIRCKQEMQKIIEISPFRD